jgi:hypothetical protein
MTIMRMMALIVATLLAVEVAVPVVTPVAVEMMMTIMRMMAAAAIAEVDVVISPRPNVKPTSSRAENPLQVRLPQQSPRHHQ